MSDLESAAGERLVVDADAHERKAALGAYWTGSRLFVAVSVMKGDGVLFPFHTTYTSLPPSNA